ncbi:ribonuclease HI family protein [Candidatus Daviesbacteria bacterium]|nr:ribonuclease HI family protein [Candidatus Daviesbacteria bacterium]
MNLHIYTDGASRGNPGPASYGFVVLDGMGNILHKEGRAIGITTNNVAEYTAVYEALKFVKNSLPSKYSSIILKADSKLVAEQLSGNFKVKSKHLKPIIEQIKILALELGGITFSHIPRQKNALADSMANRALDSPTL